MRLILASLSLVFVAACVASSYMNYGVDVTGISNPERGLLLAPKGREKEDTTLEECLPRRGLRYPCRLVKHETYLQIIKDAKDKDAEIKALKARLVSCEKR